MRIKLSIGLPAVLRVVVGIFGRLGIHAALFVLVLKFIAQQPTWVIGNPAQGLINLLLVFLLFWGICTSGVSPRWALPRRPVVWRLQRVFGVFLLGLLLSGGFFFRGVFGCVIGLPSRLFRAVWLLFILLTILLAFLLRVFALLLLILRVFFMLAIGTIFCLF